MSEAVEHEQTWNTEQMIADFEMIGFQAPFVVVIRRADRVKGSLQFQHNPRLYWGFVEHTP